MNRLLFTLILLFLVSCAKQENFSLNKLEVGKVKFEYSSDWKFTKLKGIDSYFSYLSKDEDTIWIEYGMYNPKIYKQSIQNNLFKQVTINEREVILEVSKDPKVGFASMYIPKVDSINGLYMFNKKGNIQEVLDIYKTIQLGNSTRKSSFEFNFKEFTNKNHPPGIIAYENNCLSCHSEFRYEIGPPLDQKFLHLQGKSWLENYIYSKKKSDEYNIECTQISKKESESVNEMLKYLFQK